MPGRDFDVSDAHEQGEGFSATDTQRLKKRGAEIEKQIETHHIKSLIGEQVNEADKTIELSDDDIELFTEGADITFPTAENGDELKTVLEEINDDAPTDTELKQAVKDLKKTLAETPKETISAVNRSLSEQEPITLEENDIETIDDEPENKTIEITADYEDEQVLTAQEAAKRYNQSVAEADDRYDEQSAEIQKELDIMNKVIAKNPSARTQYQGRINELTAHLSDILDERDVTVESARKKYENFADNDPNKIVSIADARAKQQAKKIQKGGSTSISQAI